MIIRKEDVKKLAGLARIRLLESELEDLGRNLEKILVYFEELREVDTSDVLPLEGGTMKMNAAREDGVSDWCASSESLIGAFPEKNNRLLKVPAVFG